MPNPQHQPSGGQANLRLHMSLGPVRCSFHWSENRPMKRGCVQGIWKLTRLVKNFRHKTLAPPHSSFTHPTFV